MISNFERQLAQLALQQKYPKFIHFAVSSDTEINCLTSAIQAKREQCRYAHLSLTVNADMLTTISFLSLLDALNHISLQKLDFVFTADALSTNIDGIATLLDKHVSARVNYPVIICQAAAQITPCPYQAFQAFNDKVIARVQQQITRTEYTDVKHEEQTDHSEYAQQPAVFHGELIDYNRFNETYRERVASDELCQAFKYEMFANMPQAIKFLSPEAATQIADHAAAFIALNADNLPQHFMLKSTQQGERVLDYDPDADAHPNNAFTPKKIQHVAAELIYQDLILPESVSTIATAYAMDSASKQLDNLWVRYGTQGVALFFETLGQPGPRSAFMIAHYLNRFPHWDRLLDDQGFLDALAKIKHYEAAAFESLTDFFCYTDAHTPFNLQDLLNGFDAFWSQWSELANKNNIERNTINGRWSHKKIGNPVVYMERLLTILKNSRNLREQLDCLHGMNLELLSVPEAKTQEDIKWHSYSKKRLLIQHQGGYLFYAQNARCEWVLTPLDTQLLLAENLPFPEFSDFFYRKGTELAFDIKYLRLYRHMLTAVGHTHHLLDNYGAYYASKYDRFHLVSPEMDLHYVPDGQQRVTFNPESTVYRVELRDLMQQLDRNRRNECRINLGTEPLPRSLPHGVGLLELAFRFIGQQQHGISLPDYINGHNEFFKCTGYSVAKMMVCALFFVSHERYQGSVNLFELLTMIERMRDLSSLMFKQLMELYQHDIRLSDEEGYVILQAVRILNEHENQALDPYFFIQMIFTHLRTKHKTRLKTLARHIDLSMNTLIQRGLLNQDNFRMTLNSQNPQVMAYSLSRLEMAGFLTQENRILLSAHGHLSRITIPCTMINLKSSLDFDGNDFLQYMHFFLIMTTNEHDYERICALMPANRRQHIQPIAVFRAIKVTQQRVLNDIDLFELHLTKLPICLTPYIQEYVGLNQVISKVPLPFADNELADYSLNLKLAFKQHEQVIRITEKLAKVITRQQEAILTAQARSFAHQLSLIDEKKAQIKAMQKLLSCLSDDMQIITAEEIALLGAHRAVRYILETYPLKLARLTALKGQMMGSPGYQQWCHEQERMSLNQQRFLLSLERKSLWANRQLSPQNQHAFDRQYAMVPYHG